MQKIGLKLKERREELGFTLRQMSDKTRVPIGKLEAIEDGDLKRLENDLSYIRFYVRYYCNALHIDFEEVREYLDASLDEYSNTTKMMKLSEVNEISDRIQERALNLNRSNRKKWDISLITFVVSVVILIITLILVFIFLILPNLSQAKDPVLVNPQMPEPIEPLPITPEESTVVEDQVLAISQVDALNYEITGYDENEELSLIVNFASNAYVRITVNGDSAVNLPSKLYNVGTTLDFKFTASDATTLEIYIGWMNGNTMFLNDLSVPLNSEIAARNGSVTLKFKCIGESA
ncbi:MAG TPA: hypothetical protein DIC19_03885 [Erysipelotrichaceae bacterium]|nr:hypothetical protein [Erysipelotrichaceae bacterium]